MAQERAWMTFSIVFPLHIYGSFSDLFIRLITKCLLFAWHWPYPFAYTHK